MDKAVHIAKNQEYLNQLKNKLLASKDNNPLFDNKSFTYNIENAYSIVFEKYINKTIRASRQEITKNNPSRSAKLRYAVRSNFEFFYPTDLVLKFKKYLNLESINV